MDYYRQPTDSILSSLNSSLSGLNASDYRANSMNYGLNIITEAKKSSIFMRFFAQFRNLMIIILLLSSAVSMSLAIASREYADLVEGITILVIVIINAIIGVVQEAKADASIEALKKKTISYVRALRDGSIKKIPAQDLTVGDVVHIEAGDIIPADLRIIEAHSLYCDESMLTGESHAALKTSECLESSLAVADQINMLWGGSVCVKGRATAVVVHVGDATQMGAIAAALSSQSKQSTPLQRSITKISRIISAVVLCIVVVIFAMELLLTPSANLVDALMVSIALAVAAIPESLPAIITIILALGVQTLSKRNVIIRHLHAVETLGSCSVICSDKTGTITENVMRVKSHFMLTPKDSAAMAIIHSASILCSDVYDTADGISGDPTELSIYSYAVDSGVHAPTLKAASVRIGEKTFDSTRKMMSVLVRHSDTLRSYTKGATDRILARCSHAVVAGVRVPIDADMRESILVANTDFGCRALRVLAFATREYEHFDTHTDIETDLTFVGLLGMIDPARKEVKSSVERVKKAGLKAIMITGDHRDTAFAVAKDVGIASHMSQVLTGDILQTMTDIELARVIHRYTVFARVSPEHKMRIVLALKSINCVVAMTGDGVNDAASIKVADIGVGMGISGTDVVKNVADMIVTDDNFASIVIAIEEGRKVFANIQKSIQFLLSTNIVEVASIFLILIFFPNNTFLLPVQILFINLVTDSLPAFALGLETIEPNAMLKPPRQSGGSLFSDGVGKNILIQGIIQTFLVMSVYLLAYFVWGAATATSASFFTIIFMQLLHSVNCKTTQSLFDTPLLANKTFNICFLVTLGLNISVAVLPFLRDMLGLSVLSISQWIIVATASVLIIPFIEITKLFTKTKKKQ